MSVEGVDAQSAQGDTFIMGYVSHARRPWARSSEFVKEFATILLPSRVMQGVDPVGDGEITEVL